MQVDPEVQSVLAQQPTALVPVGAVLGTHAFAQQRSPCVAEAPGHRLGGEPDALVHVGALHAPPSQIVCPLPA
jgi:hypothetical protein